MGVYTDVRIADAISRMSNGDLSERIRALEPASRERFQAIESLLKEHDRTPRWHWRRRRWLLERYRVECDVTMFELSP